MMKKDMAGAATMLAVAGMIMATRLPVRLRLLIPAVENSVSGNAFRPLDVVPTRKGISVEIGNTDAEGRLILCDALFEGASEKPTMMVDCATLTGAARVPSAPICRAVLQRRRAGRAALSPRARRWPIRCGACRSTRATARCSTARWPTSTTRSGAAFGGAITAALYLQEFVPDEVPWAHFDMMAWNSSEPARPAGGWRSPGGPRYLRHHRKEDYQ